MLRRALKAWRKRGLLWSADRGLNVLQEWLFDWRHGTDTVTHVKLKELTIASPNVHEGTQYQPTRLRLARKLMSSINVFSRQCVSSPLKKCATGFASAEDCATGFASAEECATGFASAEECATGFASAELCPFHGTGRASGTPKRRKDDFVNGPLVDFGCRAPD